MTPGQAHEKERHDMLLAEAERHESNALAEIRRYRAAVKHIEDVYKMRTGNEGPPSVAPRVTRWPWEAAGEA